LKTWQLSWLQFVEECALSVFNKTQITKQLEKLGSCDAHPANKISLNSLIFLKVSCYQPTGSIEIVIALNKGYYSS